MPDTLLADALRRLHDHEIPEMRRGEIDARAVATRAPTPGRRRSALAAAAVVVLLVGGLAVRAAVGPGSDGVVAGPARGDARWCAALSAPANHDTPIVVTVLPCASEATIAELGERLRSETGMDIVRHYEADVAWAQARHLFSDQPEMIEHLRRADVPPYFLVLLDDGSDGDTLQERSNGWPGVQAITVRPSGELPPEGGWPRDRVIDRVAWLMAGGPAYAGAEARTSLRSTSPAELQSALDAVDPLLDLGRPAAAPSASDERAAGAILATAEDRCGLRPRPTDDDSTTATTSTTSPP